MNTIHLVQASQNKPGVFEVVEAEYDHKTLLLARGRTVSESASLEDAEAVARTLNEEGSCPTLVVIPPDPSEGQRKMRFGECYGFDDLDRDSWHLSSGEHFVSFHGFSEGRVQDSVEKKGIATAAEARALADRLNAAGTRPPDTILAEWDEEFWKAIGEAGADADAAWEDWFNAQYNTNSSEEPAVEQTSDEAIVEQPEHRVVTGPNSWFGHSVAEAPQS